MPLQQIRYAEQDATAEHEHKHKRRPCIGNQQEARNRSECKRYQPVRPIEGIDVEERAKKQCRKNQAEGMAARQRTRQKKKSA